MRSIRPASRPVSHARNEHSARSACDLRRVAALPGTVPERLELVAEQRPRNFDQLPVVEVDGLR
jgi:hypothetical protein